MTVWHRIANVFLWSWRDIGRVTEQDKREAYLRRRRSWLERRLSGSRVIDPMVAASLVYQLNKAKERG